MVETIAQRVRRRQAKSPSKRSIPPEVWLVIVGFVVVVTVLVISLFG